jgi:hypothetical protein
MLLLHVREIKILPWIIVQKKRIANSIVRILCHHNSHTRYNLYSYSFSTKSVYLTGVYNNNKNENKPV